MSEFFLDDGLSSYFNVKPSNILSAITREQILSLLKDLGADSIIEQENQLILPTICHNPTETDKSHKLYYYFDSKLFSCYTECGQPFNLYELVRKVHAINDHEISFHEAFNFVLNYVGNSAFSIEPPQAAPIGNRYARKLSVEDLREYNKNALTIFRKMAPIEWLQEGISAKAMEKFDIRFSIPYLKIIIPHYDLKGRLVGIRGRALDEDEVQNYGKYMPVRIENTFYTHHLSRNLYGAYQNQEAIRRYQRAIVFEGEVSPLSIFLLASKVTILWLTVN